MIPRSFWLAGMITVLLAAIVPLIGRSLRDNNRDCCHWDGMTIDPAFRVRIVTTSNRSYSFCCVLCAGAWADRTSDRLSTVHVTDEASGIEVTAADAYFVRSTVPTNEVTGNRWHTFRSIADARKHADATRSRVVPVSGSPLALAGGSTE